MNQELSEEELWKWPANQAACVALYHGRQLQNFLVLNSEYQIDTFGMSCEACEREIDSKAIRVKARPHLGTSEEVMMVGACRCGHISYTRSHFTYNGPTISSHVLDPSLRTVRAGVLSAPPLAYKVRIWFKKLFGR